MTPPQPNEQPKCRNCGRIESHHFGKNCLDMSLFVAETVFEPLTTSPTKGGDGMQPADDKFAGQPRPEPSKPESVGAKTPSPTAEDLKPSDADRELVDKLSDISHSGWIEDTYEQAAQLIATHRLTTTQQLSNRVAELEGCVARANALIGSQADANDKLVKELNDRLASSQKDFDDLGRASAENLRVAMGRVYNLEEVILEGMKNKAARPIIVCLCGSTRFGQAFQDANLSETLAGKIVLSIGCNMKSDKEIFGHLKPEELTRIKTGLDELHKRKIDLCDEVLVLNVGGYIGESTRSEIEYATKLGRPIRYLKDAAMTASQKQAGSGR